MDRVFLDAGSVGAFAHAEVIAAFKAVETLCYRVEYPSVPILVGTVYSADKSVPAVTVEAKEVDNHNAVRLLRKLAKVSESAIRELAP
jgi:hypothetical protein